MLLRSAAAFSNAAPAPTGAFATVSADALLGATLGRSLDDARDSVVTATMGGQPLKMRMRSRSHNAAQHNSADAAAGPTVSAAFIELGASLSAAAGTDNNNNNDASTAATATTTATTAAKTKEDLEFDLFNPPRLNIGRITDKLWMARQDEIKRVAAAQHAAATQGFRPSVDASFDSAALAADTSGFFAAPDAAANAATAALNTDGIRLTNGPTGFSFADAAPELTAASLAETEAETDADADADTESEADADSDADAESEAETDAVAESSHPASESAPASGALLAELNTEIAHLSTAGAGAGVELDVDASTGGRGGGRGARRNTKRARKDRKNRRRGGKLVPGGAVQADAPQFPWTKARPAGCQEGEACWKRLSLYKIKPLEFPFKTKSKKFAKAMADKVAGTRRKQRKCFQCTAYLDPVRTAFLTDRASKAESALTLARAQQEMKRSVTTDTNELRALVTGAPPPGLTPEQEQQAREAAAAAEAKDKADAAAARKAGFKRAAKPGGAAKPAAGGAKKAAPKGQYSEAMLKAHGAARDRVMARRKAAAAAAAKKKSFLQAAESSTATTTTETATTATSATSATGRVDADLAGLVGATVASARARDAFFDRAPHWERAAEEAERDRAAAAAATARALSDTANEVSMAELNREAADVLVSLPEFSLLSESEQETVHAAVLAGDVEAGGYLFSRDDIDAYNMGSADAIPVLQRVPRHRQLHSGSELDSNASDDQLFSLLESASSDGSRRHSGADTSANADDYDYLPVYPADTLSRSAYVDADADSAAAAAESARDRGRDGHAYPSLVDTSSGVSYRTSYWDWSKHKGGKGWRNVTSARPMQCAWRLGASVTDDELIKLSGVSKGEEAALAQGVAAAKAETAQGTDSSLPYGWSQIKTFKVCMNEKSAAFASVLAGAMYQGEGMVVRCR